MVFLACVSFSGESRKSCLVSPSTHTESCSKVAIVLNALSKGFSLQFSTSVTSAPGYPAVCSAESGSFHHRGSFREISQLTRSLTP